MHRIHLLTSSEVRQSLLDDLDAEIRTTDLIARVVRLVIRIGQHDPALAAQAVRVVLGDVTPVIGMHGEGLRRLRDRVTALEGPGREEASRGIA